MLKKELEEQYKKAKDIIKELQKEIKELKVSTGKEVDFDLMKKTALGIYKDEEGFYKKVVIVYNAKENVAAIKEILPAARNDRNYELALFEGKRFLVEDIMGEIQKEF